MSAGGDSAAEGAPADRLAIIEQIYRYCRSVDRLDVPLGHRVFHVDATVAFPAYDGTGRGWIDFICEEHRKFLHHSHQVTNVVLELAADKAGSEAYVTATLRQRVEDGRIMQHQIWARYIDSWSKREGRWAIDKRECVIDFDEVREVTPIREHPRARRDRNDPSYAVLEKPR
ncbi:MAG: nuclear transport factor 2 family protein [Novosphingobium sp.]